MTLIPLTQGMKAEVDDDDPKEPWRFRWCAIKSGSGNIWYAMRKVRRADGTWETVLLHRFLLGVEYDIQVDHINDNGLDCRRINLRLATHSQNEQSRGKNRNNKSGYKGVSMNKQTGRWMAQIVANGQYHFLGRFTSKEAARDAYDEAARRLHGEFARTNA